MVPSISFSGRECRHADKIFAFPARTEFSVTTGSSSDDFPARTRPCNRCTRAHWDAGLKIKEFPWRDDAGDRGARPVHDDRARHGWYFWRGWGCRRIYEGGARESCVRPSWRAHASRSKYSFPPGREVGWHSDRDAGLYRSVPPPHIPGSDRRFCSQSCGRYQTPGKDQPSPRRLAGEPQTAVSHPLPNTPSKASLPPLKREKV